MKEELKNCLQELVLGHYHNIEADLQNRKQYEKAIKLIKKSKLAYGIYQIDNELIRIFLRGSTENVKPILLIDFLGKPKEIIE